MKNEDTVSLIANNIAKARNTVLQAETLFNIQQYIGAVNRAYYAMFYAALAILMTKGLGTSKHAGVISLLDKEFVSKGEIDPAWSRKMRNAFNLRSWGDYDEQAIITEAQARQILVDAETFVAWAKQWLTDKGWTEN